VLAGRRLLVAFAASTINFLDMRLWPLTWTRLTTGLFNRRHIWRTKRAAVKAGRLALRTPPMPVGANADVEVHILVCHRDVSMAIQGLKSFYRFTPVPFALVIHDDGSLDPDDRALLGRHFPGLRFIDADAAAGTLDAELTRLGLERCREFRRTFVLARRIFDFPYYSAGRMMLQLDADVIFLQRPTELLAALASTDPRSPMRFNIDVKDAYSWTDDQIRGVVGLAPAPRVNGGLVAMRYPRAILPEMWELVERCLVLPVSSETQWLRDQTLLGIIGGWHGALALPPEYDVCARLLRTGREDLVSHHCLAHQRLYFYEAFMTRVAPALFTSSAHGARTPARSATGA
jgi:hypothetical protein